MNADQAQTKEKEERNNARLSRRAVEDRALELFAELGFHASSMRAIADHIGVRPASLYHWFPSKQALLVAIMGRFLEGLTETVNSNLEGLESPAESLAVATYSHVVYHGENRLAAFVTDTELRALDGEEGETIMRLRDEYEQTFKQILVDGMESGSFQIRDSRVATFAILLQCTGVAAWYRPNGPLSLAEIGEIHAELALNSVRADVEQGWVGQLIDKRGL